MPVLVTSNFDDDSIKNERASIETVFSHYKSMGNSLDAQGQLANSIVSGQIWPKFELLRDFLHVLVTCKIIKKGSDQKQLRKSGDIVFPIISQWELSVAMETRVLIQSASKPYAAFPHPSDATHKI